MLVSLKTLTLGFLLSGLFSYTNAQSLTIQQNNQKELVDKLRDLYLKRDFEGGYEIGKKFVKQFPDNIELNAWFITNISNTQFIRKDAIPLAEALVKKDKESAFVWFALANSLVNNRKIVRALAANERALSIAPTNQFMILQHADILSRTDFSYKKSLDFLEKNKNNFQNQEYFLTAKSDYLYSRAFLSDRDEKEFAEAYQLLEEAQKIAPQNLDAYYFAGQNYVRSVSPKAYPLLKKSVEISPGSIRVREAFWRAILEAQPEKTPTQKKAELVSNIIEFANLRSNYPQSLITVISEFGKLLMPDRKKVYENLFLKKNLNNLWTEIYLLIQIENLKSRAHKDSKLKPQLTQMLWDFIHRRLHYNTEILGSVYYDLLNIIKEDKTKNNRQLMEVINKLVKIDRSKYLSVGKILAEREMLEKAEEFTRLANVEVEKNFAEKRIDFDDENEYQNAFNGEKFKVSETLGNILAKRGKYEEAESELLKAKELTTDNDYLRRILLSLGDVYKGKKDFEKAESTYFDAYSISTIKGENYDRLKLLYEIHKGNISEYETYLTKAKKNIFLRSKKFILASQIKNPISIKPFNLEKIDGKNLSADEFRGKVLVINIWGTWCKPCVSEMPEFQQLYKKYIGDDEVAILTISSGDELETVKNFMTSKKYDFPVLIDRDYVENINIKAFPTTWFINKQGKIIFVKEGNTENLLEEFSWRIEELKIQTQ